MRKLFLAAFIVSLISVPATAALLALNDAKEHDVALSDYQSLVPNLVRDSSSLLQTSDRDAAIALAVTRYSEDKPRSAVADLTGTGVKLVDLPAGWQAGFSRIVSIEYPMGAAPPSLMAQESYSLYTGLSSTQILFVSALPAAATARATFTQAHLLDADNDTIPLKDREAVANWAASLMLQQLANHYSGAGSPTIAADAVDWQSRGGEFARRAKESRQFYFDHIGVDPKKNRAAGVVVDFDRMNSLGGERLIHRGSRNR